MPGFGTALGIDFITRGGKLVQDVESLKFGEQLALKEGTSELYVPNPVGGVHLVLLIATAGKHRHVGGKLEMPGQIERGIQSDVIISCMNVGEAFASSVYIIIGGGTMQRELVAIVGAEGELEFIVQSPIVHDAAQALCARCGGGHVDVVVIGS